MNVKEIKNYIFQRGSEAGLSEIEIYLEENYSLIINAYNSQIDDYKIANETLLNLRGTYKGKTGYSYTEKLNKLSFDEMIENVIETAKNNHFYEPITNLAMDKEGNKLYYEELEKTYLNEKFETILDMEKTAYQLDKRIISVNFCTYRENIKKIYVINNKGIDIKDNIRSIHVTISVVAKDNNDVKTGFSNYIGETFNNNKAQKLVKNAVNDALEMLHAKSIKSGRYEILLRNNVSTNILQAFTDIFSAEKAINDLSKFKRKINKKVATEKLTIIDDPNYKNGVYKRKFDDEGTPTEKHTIISNGVLKTLLYNQRIASIEEAKSTGNGFRPDHKSRIGIAPTNLFIKEGNKSFQDLINSIKYGLLIIDVQGIHAGLNPITGDFSLAAHGFLIENGKITRPVNQITIGGNFYNMIHDITDIGNDLTFISMNKGCVGAPSLKVKSLMIGGK